MESELLPLSLKLENRIGIRRGVLLVLVLFLLLCLPWLTSQRELFRQEGLYAAVAADYVENQWNPASGLYARAHNVPQNDVWPLYPALVSLLYRCNIPMESALRIISAVMLGILSLMAGIAAGIRINKRAGIVAACCCFGTVFAMQKGIYGGPEVMAACFLLAAQLLFFHYGSRLADWNSAWIASAIFLSLGFLTSGPLVLLFFVMPLVFLRRPLSFAGKFRTPGFLAGVVLLAVVVIFWALPLGVTFRHYAGNAELQMISTGEYWKEVLLFPLEFPVRMMPWTLIMWMPFCVALQANTPAPVFCRYLRTLFFSMLALVWLIPGISSSNIFFLIGPLAILTALSYELGVRRYGRFIRKALIVCGFFFPVSLLLIAAVTFLPQQWLAVFGEPAKMVFRSEIPGYIWLSLGGMLVLTGICAFYAYGIRRFPIWTLPVLLCFGFGVVATVMFLPYRLMEKEWRILGMDVRKVLPENTERLYKYEIEGMYCGLFYVGKPIYKLSSSDELARLPEETVYVVSSRLPLSPERVWTPLLPDDYTCRGVPVSVWRGVLRHEEEYLDAEDE